ncbi:MAG: RluA family pseudouridine synthase [Actinobacteria bacterium]|nr:RluA family pseudouridine synthase [Actinomycetota bacterium]
MSALRHLVQDEEAGIRLDRFVGAMPEVESRAEAQRLIAAGRVLVDGVPARNRLVLTAGQAVSVAPHPPRAFALTPEPDGAVVIHYEDDHLLIVDKPAGMASHPSRGHDHGTLVHALLGHHIVGGDDPTRPGIVHRLDRDTSGLLVVARDPRSHRRLQRALHERLIERRYRALVHGTPPPALTIDRPIGRDRRRRTRMSTATDRPREAVTHMRLVEAIGAFSLVDVRLETGRTHQIRVHLEAAGHCVAGDPTYRAHHQDPLAIGRQFLHAWRL